MLLRQMDTQGVDQLPQPTLGRSQEARVTQVRWLQALPPVSGEYQKRPSTPAGSVQELMCYDH